MISKAIRVEYILKFLLVNKAPIDAYSEEFTSNVNGITFFHNALHKYTFVALFILNNSTTH